MGYDFDGEFNKFVKSEEAAGRPIPEGLKFAVRANRATWCFANMIAKDVHSTMDGGAVKWGEVLDVLDRLPMEDERTHWPLPKTVPTE